MNGIEGLPNISAPMVGADGKTNPVWMRFFERLFKTPDTETLLTVGPSPYQYQATKDGFVLVIGGTVSEMYLSRGVNFSPTAYQLGITNGQVILRKGDALSVVYSSAPIMAFFPD